MLRLLLLWRYPPDLLLLGNTLIIETNQTKPNQTLTHSLYSDGAEWQANQDYTAFYHSTAAYYHDYNNYPQPQAVDGNGSAYHAYTLEQTQLHQKEANRRKDEESIRTSERYNVLDSVGYPARIEEDASLLFEKIGQVGEGTYG